MTVDSVEEPGEAEAEHCPQKEHPKNHLLLQRGHEVHIWSEHGQDSQKEKQHKTCRREKKKKETKEKDGTCTLTADGVKPALKQQGSTVGTAV